MNTEKGQALYRRAKEILPGGTQLLSKRPELFAPNQWPPYYSKASGCAIWDMDGNRFLDMTYMGIGSCILGYADPAVNEAVKRVIEAGSMTTLNSPLEVELAELLLTLHPWARMVRFARTGGEVMAAAVRIARGASGRDGVAFCGYHGWHDWYLAANLGDTAVLDGHLLPGLEPKGVPRGLAGTMHPFHYNDIEELDRVLDQHGKGIGVIVMEPIRFAEPQNGFLAKVKERARKIGAVLVFDEITCGWRYGLCGAHRSLGVEPDLAVYAKAMGNGFPSAAIVGTEAVMKVAWDLFISSTYWTEQIGSAAALATLRELARRDAPTMLREAGLRVQGIWKDTAVRHGVPIAVEGRPALCHFSFQGDKAPVLGTLLTQELLERGYLGNTAFYASCAHTPQILGGYAGALEETFAVLRRAVDSGAPEGFLRGPLALKGFARLT